MAGRPRTRGAGARGVPGPPGIPRPPTPFIAPDPHVYSSTTNPHRCRDPHRCPEGHSPVCKPRTLELSWGQIFALASRGREEGGRGLCPRQRECPPPHSPSLQQVAGALDLADWDGTDPESRQGMKGLMPRPLRSPLQAVTRAALALQGADDLGGSAARQCQPLQRGHGSLFPGTCQGWGFHPRRGWSPGGVPGPRATVLDQRLCCGQHRDSLLAWHCYQAAQKTTPATGWVPQCPGRSLQGPD